MKNGAACAWRCCRRAAARSGADKIGLHEAQAVMAQDGVGHRAMEIEVRQRITGQVGLTLELQFPRARPEPDLPLLLAIDLGRADRGDVGTGPGVARWQFGQAGLVVRETGRFLAGETGAGALVEIAGDLHLAREWRHVSREWLIEQHRRVVLSAWGPGP